MDILIIVILINILIIGLCSYVYYRYDITAPLAMSVIILLLSTGLVFIQDETYYKNECLICNDIMYSNEKDSMTICNDCKDFIKELKEREE